MTTESATAFAERLKTDEAFARKLAEAGSREERRSMAREAGYDLSDDDMPAIRSALGIGELSDEDLERVAGGIGEATGVSIAGSVTGVLSFLTGVAATA